MSSQFYNSIIEDEKKMFGIKDETLKMAAKDIQRTYSPAALRNGSTFLEYNLPQNRCAYMYKFATLHTELVFKYFHLMMNHDAVKFILNQKKDLKICCLGGGPGTDIVGIVKALATLPSCHQKVTEVTVLDLCGGWRNSFKHIISRLKHGKVGNVPAKFLDCNNFKANLTAVNLLEAIPPDVLKVISSADIICMVKFVSAILGKSESSNALKVIGEKIKLGTVVLFIDNFHGKVFEPLEDICKKTGLSAILGPLHVFHRSPGSMSRKNLYGCLPLRAASVSVIGWIKTATSAINTNDEPKISIESNYNENYDNNWDTESDSEDTCVELPKSSAAVKSNCEKICELITKSSCNKFTQTESKYFKKVSKLERDGKSSISDELSELPSIIEAMSGLLKVLNLKQNHANTKKQCCCRYLKQHCVKNSCNDVSLVPNLIIPLNKLI